MKNYVYLKNGTKVVIIDTLASGKWIVEPIVEYQLEEGVPMSMAMGKMLVTDEVYDDRPKKEDMFFTRELKDDEYEYRGTIVEKWLSNSFRIHFTTKLKTSDFKDIEGIDYVFTTTKDYCLEFGVAKAFNSKAVIQNIIDNTFPKESVSLTNDIDFEFIPDSPKRRGRPRKK